MADKPAQDPFEAAGDPRRAAGEPKHATRATRSAGRKMRSLLLDAASPLFRERGLSGTSIADIATAANAFPSQITYYFRT
jgi:AcrR family transcriptional regulator